MAKYCTHCGSEINENAVVCIKCGCAILNMPSKIASCSAKQAESNHSTQVSFVLGTIGIVSAWLFALVGHITSIIGIVLGIKEYRESEKMTGLVLSIIGEVCSVFSSIIGAVTLSSYF